MTYIANILGIENKKFDKLNFLRINDSTFRLYNQEINVQISQENLFKFINLNSIDSGVINSTITFFQNENGELIVASPYDKDAKKEMKRAGALIKHSDIELGQKIDFMFNTLRYNGFKEYFSCYYGGIDENSKFKFLVQTDNGEESFTTVKFPHVFKTYQEFI